MIRARIRPLLLAALILAPPVGADQAAEQIAEQQDAPQADLPGETPDAAPGAPLFAQANRFHNGNGVLQNFAKAAALYQQAATLGHAAAQNRLGQYYHSGLGVAQSQPQALRWLQAAADQGDRLHIFDLASALEQGADDSSAPTRAAALYQQAADLGHADAAVSLAVLYQNGTGVAQNFARAFDLYQGPATEGHARAQNNLGLLYVRGSGVAQDYTRAAALFAKAAAQGQVTAMRNLSVMYGNGLGVDQSDAKAADWERRASQQRQGLTGPVTGPETATRPPLCHFDPRLAAPAPDSDLAAQQRAAEAGDPVAQFLTGWRLCTQAKASAAQLREAGRWFKAAAHKGHGASMANLGGLYLQGRGVPQDYVLGYMWLTLAHSMGLSVGLSEGQPLALADSAALRQRMTAAQINEAQQRASVIWQEIRNP